MLCTILQATQFQPIPKPAATGSTSFPESDTLPVIEDQLESTSSGDFPVPETGPSKPAPELQSALQPALKPDHMWLLTEDLDEHIDSFMSNRDRAKFSRTSHSFQHEMEYFCRRRLKLEYQSDPKPFRSYEYPEKRKEIRFPTDRQGREFVKNQLSDRPFLLGKVTAGKCSLQEALEVVQINSSRIDTFLRADTTPKEASTRVKNFRRLIECGILSIEECVQATGDAAEARIDEWLFESYWLAGSLDKSRLLDLTREEARILTEPLVQGLIFAKRALTASQVLDLLPSDLERLKEQLRQYILSRGPSYNHP